MLDQDDFRKSLFGPAVRAARAACVNIRPGIYPAYISDLVPRRTREAQSYGIYAGLDAGHIFYIITFGPAYMLRRKRYPVTSLRVTRHVFDIRLIQ